MRVRGAIIGVLMVVGGVTISGCAGDEPILRDRIKLIGQPLQEFVQCAGAPSREFTRGNLTVLTYSQSSSRLLPGPGAVVHQQCDLSVSFENDRAINVTYLIPEDNALTTCEPIIRACSSRAGGR